MKNHFKTTGIILRRVNFGEADQILTILTPDLGKMSVMAKGVRRLKSKFCGRLELLYQVHLTGYLGRSLGHLNEATLLNATPLLDFDLGQHKVLFTMAEITERLMPEAQENEVAYGLLEQALLLMADGAEADTVLHAYLIKLLSTLGYMGSWKNCARSGQEVDLGEALFLNMQEGCLVKQAYATSLDVRLTPPLVKWVHFMQKYPFADIMKVTTSQGDRQQVWQMLTSMLGHTLSSPLKSLQFFM